MPADEGPRWVVLKFGGTSVATAESWAVIIDEVFRVRAAGERACVVVSAVSQVTNHLNKCIEEALNDVAPSQENSSYEWIRRRHQTLAEEIGVAGDEEGMKPLRELLEELKRLLEGIRLTREASARLSARISAFGELMSSHLGALVIRKTGCECVRLDARQLIHSSETMTQQDADRFLNANVNPTSNRAIVDSEMKKAGDENAHVITQGFIGSTPKGETCLLGRGGSDTSGALFATLLAAVRLEIWTDVHGLFTSDPRHVNQTRLIRQVSYRVAQELASMGAKVLHPRCLVPAQWGNIPVEVHNTQDPRGPFTCIFERRTESPDELPSKARRLMGIPQLMAVTQRSGQVLINITNPNMWGEAGFLQRCFAPFGELDVSVDLVATSQYAVSLTLDHIPGGVKGDVFARLMERLGALGHVNKHEPCSVVSVVGEHLRNALPDLGKALSETLAELTDCNVHLMTQSSEDLNLSWVVDEDQSKMFVQGLHNRLFAEPAKAMNGDAKVCVFGDTWEKLRTVSAKPPTRRVSYDGFPDKSY